MNNPRCKACGRDGSEASAVRDTFVKLLHKAESRSATDTQRQMIEAMEWLVKTMDVGGYLDGGKYGFCYIHNYKDHFYANTPWEAILAAKEAAGE